jgi:hypothetical protein
MKRMVIVGTGLPGARGREGADVLAKRPFFAADESAFTVGAIWSTARIESTDAAKHEAQGSLSKKR